MKYKILKRVALGVMSFLFVGASVAQSTCAVEYTNETYGIGMSPLSQKISLNPGDSYTGTFSINNVSKAQEFGYTTEIQPYYVDENYTNTFDQENSYTQMTNWTTIGNGEGVLPAGGQTDISYTINVPYDAPAGGQYMALTVISNDDVTSESSEGTAVGIVAKQAMAFLVYAEIAGTTTHSGEIFDVNVPSFLLSGNISGTSSVKNTGNTHSAATYKLQVFPLFSNEEVYTNEEEPETRTVLPDRTFVNVSSWENTPSVGIFNVKYTVEFEGETTTVEKMVIKCPIWLLFTIIFAIIALVVWLVLKAKNRKKSTR